MSGKQEIIKSMIGGRHDILIIGQKTNADRIRAMSDEELADFLLHICDWNWLDWLKAPAEVQDGT